MSTPPKRHINTPQGCEVQYENNLANAFPDIVQKLNLSAINCQIIVNNHLKIKGQGLGQRS